MAEGYRLPQKLRSNFHVHTRYSPCCTDKENCRPELLLRAGEAVGLTEMGFTDHFFVPREGLSAIYGASEMEFLLLRNEVRSLESEKVRALLSWEVDVYGPKLYSFHEKYLEELDYVLVACHFYPTEPERLVGHSPDWTAARVMKRMMLAATAPFADIVAHPFLMQKSWYPDVDRIFNRVTQNQLEEFLHAVRENGVALEFSPVMFRPDLWNVENAYRIYQTAVVMDVPMAIGSDSHRLAEVPAALSTVFIMEKLGLSDSRLVCFGELKSARGRRS